MERKTWVMPMTLVQEFEANETVAADTQCWYVGCNTNESEDWEWDYFRNLAIHYSSRCGNPSRQVLRDTDGDGYVDEMIETSDGGYKCTLYTDKYFKETVDLQNFHPNDGDTIYWLTRSGLVNYHHIGTVQIGDTSHPNRS